ncbi:MAG: type II toxin-antitoxin system VapB family antitoxin [Pseudomonadales bacterium]|nr:type II toxin-antitoxin system VapB family antitoxin [Pseudomonadales bacterium]
MSINIKDPETDQLARDLANKTGESITLAVKRAIAERLQRETAKLTVSLADQVLEISERAATYKRRSRRTQEEIIGYDDRGLPK